MVESRWVRPHWIFSSLCFVAVIKCWPKVTSEMKGFLWLTHPDSSPSLREVKVGTQTGTEAGRNTYYCLTPYSLLSLFYYTIQNRLLWASTASSIGWSWTLPHKSLTEKISHDILMGQSDGGNSSFEVHSSWMALVSVKLTRTIYPVQCLSLKVWTCAIPSLKVWACAILPERFSWIKWGYRWKRKKVQSQALSSARGIEI